MVSIGELGNIYDPHRVSAGGVNQIIYARGGGRSLKIGQPDDLIAGSSRFSETWQRAAWLLTDLFGVDPDRNLNTLPASKRGKININSALRDNGVAISAALRRLTFLPSPESDRVRTGTKITDAEIAELVASIKEYVSDNGGPLVERGEISEISFFSSSANQSIGGGRNRTTNDRGREEIFRRLIEMITTRSLAFSVYTVGEQLRESPTGQLTTLSRATRGTVYELTPVFGAGSRPKAENYLIEPVYEIQ